MKPNTRLRKLVEDGTVRVFADDMVSKRDGTLELRTGYFYRGGRSAEGWGAKVKTAMHEAGQNVELVAVEDNWNEWPKDSYFSAFVRPVE